VRRLRAFLWGWLCGVSLLLAVASLMLRAFGEGQHSPVGPLGALALVGLAWIAWRRSRVAWDDWIGRRRT
jgi:uncharacterized protein (TIGR03382 family)